MKKGEVSLWFLIEIIGAFLIGYLLFDVSVSIAKGTIYEKLNIAKDLAMQINTLSGIPGNAYIINKNLHGYSLYFSNNKIEVFKGDSDQTKGTYYFVKIGKSNLDVKLNNPKQVVVSKINGEIKISEDIQSLR
ncbi:hypothetical protein HYW20_01445 [Candidatus Woesearchaeota archaeon]|nr:hypothetical protein [Candidatus Woesearchaeota archaeon]